jgi:hypothetical protein
VYGAISGILAATALTTIPMCEDLEAWADC